MITEKVQAQIIAEVDDASLKKAGEDTKIFARDTKKELDRAFLFKLQLDKANTKIELDNARALLRQAKKDGDEALILKYTIKTDELQSKLTEAGGKLRNFKNLGDTEVSRLGTHFDRLAEKLGGMNTVAGRTILNMQNGFSGLTGIVGGLITKLGGLAVGAGLYQLGSQALFLGDKLEQANISFTTMLGSAEKAKQLLYDLSIFAANTPFELIGLRDTAKQLLAFGIQQESLIPTMKALGDVSAGLSVPIGQIAYAYGQVRVAGRLMGGELMQFTNAGVPLIEELSKNLGVAQKDIKKMVSEGKIGFTDVQKAFKTMTEEGGRFADLMDKQTVTLSGRWSNLKDTFNSFLESVGTDIIPFAKAIVMAMSFALTWVQKLYNGFKVAFNFIDGIVGFTVISVVNYFHQLFDFFRLLPKNLAILGENFGIAFDNVPGSVAKALDATIGKIESFINKASNGINKFAKMLGFEGDLVKNIKLDRIGDAWGKQPQFKNFDLGNSFELRDSGKKYFMSQMGDIMDIVENGATKTKELNTELVLDEEDKQDKITEAAKSGGAKREKDAEDFAKKDLERRKKLAEYLEKKEEERVKKAKEREEKIAKGKDIVTDYYEAVRDEIDESQKKLDEFDDKVEESQNKIADLKKELSEETADVGLSLAERRLEILQKISDLEKENPNIKGFSGISEDVLKSIGGDTFGDGLTGDKILEAKKLYEELALIDSNASLVTENAKDQASESETERILREYNEKKASIEAEIELENQKLISLQTQKEQEKQIYLELDQYRLNLEKNFTGLFDLEIQKRISSLEKMRAKAIETANALVSAGITNDVQKAEQVLAPQNNVANTYQFNIEGGNSSPKEIAKEVYAIIEEESYQGNSGYFPK